MVVLLNCMPFGQKLAKHRQISIFIFNDAKLKPPAPAPSLWQAAQQVRIYTVVLGANDSSALAGDTVTQKIRIPTNKHLAN